MKLKPILFLLVISALISCQRSYAQKDIVCADIETTDFLDNLGDSTSSVEIMRDAEWVTGQRGDIPSWVFMSPGSGRILAVSDPCLSVEAGTKQALLRAWFLHLMAKDAKIEIVIENFQKIKQMGSYDASSFDFNQFVRITPTSRTTAFKITNSWTSLFGETFVEVAEVEQNKTKCDILFSKQENSLIGAEYAVHGSDHIMSQNHIRSELSLFCTTLDEQISNYYLRIGGVENFTLMRTYNNQEITNAERGRFWYFDSYNAPKTSKKDDDKDLAQYSGESLSDGIWAPLYEKMTSTIVNYENFPYKMKTVDEQSDDRTYVLVRSIFSGKASVTLKSLSIKDNKLIPQWNINLK